MVKSLILVASLVSGLQAASVSAATTPELIAQHTPVSEAQGWFPPLAVAVHGTSLPVSDPTTAALLGVGIYQSEMTALWSHLDNVDADLAPIPAGPKVAHVSEPATLGLLGLGLAAIALVRNRHRRTAD
ncbi:MAG: PEP-CTERM sorting domain-containing protein [Hahellaceae bacterium]|nr:PEP-CTERM sorting domain-containing protein [Hahellaceae bacterium]